MVTKNKAGNALLNVWNLQCLFSIKVACCARFYKKWNRIKQRHHQNEIRWGEDTK